MPTSWDDPFDTPTAAWYDPPKTKTSARKVETEMTPIKPKEGFTFGCDPELFIVNSKGVPVTAEGLIPGTKANPFKVNKGAVQVDGMAAEFNTDPASSFEEFNDNITTVMAELKAMIPSDHRFLIVPSVRFAKEVFDAAPECAKELGCNPDFNAWTSSVNMPPSCDDDPYLRTASGHVHIGWEGDHDIGDAQHIMNCQDLVKQLDWYLAGWSLRQDTDATRRKLYGNAGAYRPKPYGVEYRVLSNFWITTKERRMLVWNRMQTAINDMSSRYLPERLPSRYSELLVASINASTPNPNLESEIPYPLLNNDSRNSRYL